MRWSGDAGAQLRLLLVSVGHPAGAAAGAGTHQHVVYRVPDHEGASGRLIHAGEQRENHVGRRFRREAVGGGDHLLEISADAVGRHDGLQRLPSARGGYRHPVSARVQFAEGLRHSGEEAAVHLPVFREYLPVQPGRIPGLGVGEVSDLLE